MSCLVPQLFRFISYSAVHNAIGVGVQAPLSTVARYDATIELDANKVLAAMVTEVDWSLGNITHVLRDVGVWNNTVTVFLSDNGVSVSHGGSKTPALYLISPRFCWCNLRYIHCSFQICRYWLCHNKT